MKNKTLITTALIFNVILFNCQILYSQGTWNIKYLPIETVDSSFIGREVRLDLKSNSNDLIKIPFKSSQIRHFLDNKDSVSITIHGKKVIFKENWEIYPDHGIIQEQSLKMDYFIDNNKLVLKEIFIESMNESSICFKANVYHEVKFKKDIITIECNEERFALGKNIIKGLLVKK